MTVFEYKDFVDSGYPAPHDWERQIEVPSRPVVNVSWCDATAAMDCGCLLLTNGSLRPAAGNAGNIRGAARNQTPRAPTTSELGSQIRRPSVCFRGATRRGHRRSRRECLGVDVDRQRILFAEEGKPASRCERLNSNGLEGIDDPDSNKRVPERNRGGRRKCAASQTAPESIENSGQPEKVVEDRQRTP